LHGTTMTVMHGSKGFRNVTTPAAHLKLCKKAVHQALQAHGRGRRLECHGGTHEGTKRGGHPKVRVGVRAGQV
jgi:hypothetical protein